MKRPTVIRTTVALLTALLLVPGIATGEEGSFTAKSIASGLGSMGQGSEKRRAEAEKELLDLGADAAKPLASLLIETPLEGPESAQIQRGVVGAFKLLGADGRNGVSVLEKGVMHDDQSLRDAAINSLGAIGAEAEPAVPTIIESLERRKFSTKLHASAVLREILHADVRYVEMLSDRLGDEASAQLRIGAALALGYLGRNDKEVMKTLAALSKHEDATVRGNATAALAHLATERRRRLARITDASPALVRALGDEDPLVRRNALNALSSLGALAYEALWEALNSDSPSRRMEAIRAIDRQGAGGKVFEDHLRQVADGAEKEELRKAAEEALKGLEKMPDKNGNAESK